MPISHERRTIVTIALGTAQTLSWGSTYYLPAILAVPMAREFGISTDWVYGIFSVAMLMTAFMGPAVGRRIDRFGGRGILMVSSLVFATGLGLLGWSPNLPVFIAGWLIIGLGMGMGLYEAAFAALTAIYGTGARNSITGITLLAGFASTVCWPISAFVDAEMGWRATCYVWAVAHLVLALPIYVLMIPKELGEHTRPEASAAATDGAPLWNRQMILLAFAFAATWITSTAMAAHLPRLLEDAGATKTAAIAAAALVGPAQVAARVLEFSVLQRFHPLLSARLASITHPIGAAAVLLFGAPAAYFFTIIHGSGNGVMTIAKGTLPLAIFGPYGYGRRQGLLAAPSRFGQAASPFVFAVLIEHFGVGALMFTSGLCVAGFIAMMLLRTESSALERASV
ncbi:MFS transporter [Ferrovibrio xuzhouensis]|uniref:MFS transporter n=1 Tax=Ferrovibrio xuzhouensis TaxID=1576914 RepID=A0ABV7VBP1_9PROT